MIMRAEVILKLHRNEVTLPVRRDREEVVSESSLLEVEVWFHGSTDFYTDSCNGGQCKHATYITVVEYAKSTNTTTIV